MNSKLTKFLLLPLCVIASLLPARELPQVNSFEELKSRLIYFRLRERTKTEVDVREVTITTGGPLPQYVMVKRDGVTIVDKEATAKLKKRKARKKRTKTKRIRERRKVVIGVNADELAYLLDLLFDEYGQAPQAIREWQTICEKARSEYVRNAIMGHIYNICGEYNLVPQIARRFKNVPKPEFLTTPEERAAFATMVFSTENTILPVLATLRLYVTMDEELEPALIKVCRQPRLNPIVRPMVFLLLGRSNGSAGDEFLLKTAMTRPDYAVFAWEALARRRTEVPLAAIKNAMRDRNETVRLGAVRYCSSMAREDSLPYLTKLGGKRNVSEIEFFNIWLALEAVCGKGQVPYDPRVWARMGAETGEDTDNTKEEIEDEEYNQMRSYYDIDMTSRRIVFICDKSLSMTAAGRWEQLTQNLIGTVQELSSDYKFTTVFYGVSTEAFSRRLVPASKTAMRKFNKFMDRQEPAGAYTYTSRGLEYGYSIPRVNTAYLMSDGLPYGESPVASFRVIREEDPEGKIILHTISVEAEQPFQDDMLFLLAQLGWGDFVAAENSKMKYFISADLQTIKTQDSSDKQEEALDAPPAEEEDVNWPEAPEQAKKPTQNEVKAEEETKDGAEEKGEEGKEGENQPEPANEEADQKPAEAAPPAEPKPDE